MFKDTENGFHITFENGFTASVQWNVGTYTDNQFASIKEVGLSPKSGLESKTAEVAVWHRDGDLLHLPTEGDEVGGYKTPAEVVAFLANVAAIPTEGAIYRKELPS